MISVSCRTVVPHRVERSVRASGRRFRSRPRPAAAVGGTAATRRVRCSPHRIGRTGAGLGCVDLSVHMIWRLCYGGSPRRPLRGGTHPRSANGGGWTFSAGRPGRAGASGGRRVRSGDWAVGAGTLPRWGPLVPSQSAWSRPVDTAWYAGYGSGKCAGGPRAGGRRRHGCPVSKPAASPAAEEARWICP